MENKIITIKVGNPDYPTNCYLVIGNDKNAVLIDPGEEANKILSKINEESLKVNKILLTHCHSDHIGALEEIVNAIGSNVYIHINDAHGIFDDSKAYFSELGIKKQDIDKKIINEVSDGDIIEDSGLSFEIIHTPGHTDGSICIYEKNLKVLFTGDTIFKNCYGRCDLKSGSSKSMGESIDNIFNRFNDILIFPRSRRYCY